MADEMFDEFMVELAELLATLERDLVSVDGGREPSEVVGQTFRIFHTVKGSAGFLGFANLGGVAHAAEDLLAGVRGGTVTWTRQVTDLLLEAFDALRRMLDEAIKTQRDGDEAYTDLSLRLRAAAVVEAKAATAPEAASLPLPALRAEGRGEGHPAAPAPQDAKSSPPAGPPPEPIFKPQRAPPRRAHAPPPPPATPAAPAVKPAPPAASAAPPAASAAPPAAPAATLGAAPGEKRPEPAGEAPDAAGALRVPLAVLDRLMNQVGELVLARNQLLCHEPARDDARLAATIQRVDQLTAGLQESVMKARMQPIDNVFSPPPARLPRRLPRLRQGGAARHQRARRPSSTRRCSRPSRTR